MNEDKQLINYYFQLLHTIGYIYTKTSMGFELNRTDRKFSIIQIGDSIYDVFYNKKERTTYQLVDRLLGQISMIKCLQWILLRAKERN